MKNSLMSSEPNPFTGEAAADGFGVWSLFGSLSPSEL